MSNAIPSAVYVMEAGDLIKIGRSASPENRAKDLAGLLGPVTVRYRTDVRSDASLVESAAHKRLAQKLVHGELFRATPDEGVVAIEMAIRDVEIRADAARCKRCKPTPLAPNRARPRLTSFPVDSELECAITDLRVAAFHSTRKIPSKGDVIRQAVFDAAERVKAQKASK